MFTIIKKSISVVLTLGFMLIFSIVLSLPVKAATNSADNISLNHNESIQSNKFKLPALQLGEKKSHNVKLSNGEVGIISVEKIADFKNKKNLYTGPVFFSWRHWSTTDDVTDGTYKISVITGVANAGFTVDISDYSITSAYDPWHFLLASSASGSLTHDSSTQATYFMNFSFSIPWVGGPSWTGGVQARIEGNSLVTYWD